MTPAIRASAISTPTKTSDDAAGAASRDPAVRAPTPDDRNSAVPRRPPAGRRRQAGRNPAAARSPEAAARSPEVDRRGRPAEVRPTARSRRRISVGSCKRGVRFGTLANAAGQSPQRDRRSVRRTCARVSCDRSLGRQSSAARVISRDSWSSPRCSAARSHSNANAASSASTTVAGISGRTVRARPAATNSTAARMTRDDRGADEAERVPIGDRCAVAQPEGGGRGADRTSRDDRLEHAQRDAAGSPTAADRPPAAGRRPGSAAPERSRVCRRKRRPKPRRTWLRRGRR